MNAVLFLLFGFAGLCYVVGMKVVVFWVCDKLEAMAKKRLERKKLYRAVLDELDRIKNQEAGNRQRTEELQRVNQLRFDELYRRISSLESELPKKGKQNVR